MPAIIGTILLVAAALIGWKIWLSSWLIFDVDQQHAAPIPAPEPTHVPALPQQIVIDFRHVSEIISASDHHVSILITFVLVVVVLAWMNIRITRIHVDARRQAPPHYDPPRLENHRGEEYRGNLPAKRDNNPFTDWRE